MCIRDSDGKKEVKTADGGVWRRAAQITYVHITKDENGLEQLEAQGYMLSWWLNKRCIYPVSYTHLDVYKRQA